MRLPQGFRESRSTFYRTPTKAVWTDGGESSVLASREVRKRATTCTCANAAHADLNAAVLPDPSDGSMLVQGHELAAECEGTWPKR